MFLWLNSRGYEDLILKSEESVWSDMLCFSLHELVWPGWCHAGKIFDTGARHRPWVDGGYIGGGRGGVFISGPGKNVPPIMDKKNRRFEQKIPRKLKF